MQGQQSPAPPFGEGPGNSMWSTQSVSRLHWPWPVGVCLAGSPLALSVKRGPPLDFLLDFVFPQGFLSNRKGTVKALGAMRPPHAP